MKVLTWWIHPGIRSQYDAIIADGAVRSGKTLSMSVSFVLWAMSQFDGANFAICGKTVESCKRNVITPLLSSIGGLISFRQVQSRNYIEARYRNNSNRIYIFGGKDEGSAALIQGVTLAGVLLDEVALMPRSFVEQALARCSVTGSRLWFNCNPDHPYHWFYTEWIKKAEQKRTLYLHFTMDDNLTLAPEIKARYRSLYAGVFYDRFVLGRWVAANGIIYPMFNSAFHVVPDIPRPYERYMISCDYGTLNPTSAGLWGLAQGSWYRIREYYYDGRKEQYQKTDEEHYAEIEKLAGALPVFKIIVDPSAASFIEVIRRHGRFMVEQASNRVIDGIRDVAVHLKAGDLFICNCCKDCIREFGMYQWDEKAIEDRPLKTNDHAMDDVRYFVRAVFAPPRFSF